LIAKCKKVKLKRDQFASELNSLLNIDLSVFYNGRVSSNIYYNNEQLQTSSQWSNV